MIKHQAARLAMTLVVMIGLGLGSTARADGTIEGTIRLLGIVGTNEDMGVYYTYGTVEVDTFDFIHFSNGPLVIDVLSHRFFDNSLDGAIRLYEDDGQPLSNSNLVLVVDDYLDGMDPNGSPTIRDPYVEIPNLPAGVYTLTFSYYTANNEDAQNGSVANAVLEGTAGVPPTEAQYRIDFYGDLVLLDPAITINDGISIQNPQSEFGYLYTGQTEIDQYLIEVHSSGYVIFDVLSFQYFDTSIDSEIGLYLDDSMPFSPSNQVAFNGLGNSPDLNGSLSSLDSFLLEQLDPGTYRLVVGSSGLNYGEMNAGMQSDSWVYAHNRFVPNEGHYAVDIFGDVSLLPFEPASCPADLNGDGQLDFLDISAFLASYNSGCP